MCRSHSLMQSGQDNIVEVGVEVDGRAIEDGVVGTWLIIPGAWPADSPVTGVVGSFLSTYKAVVGTAGS